MTLSWHGLGTISRVVRSVCYNGKLSTVRDVGMGIAQGSILLFVVFIIDICDLSFQEYTKLWLFANDTALFFLQSLVCQI